MPKKPKEVLVLSDAEVSMATYLCDSREPCNHHKKQAMELYAMAHSEGLEYDAQDVMERACTSKTRYRSPNAAGAAAKTAKEQRGVHGLRVYACEFCSGFHLSKVALEDFVSKPNYDLWRFSSSDLQSTVAGGSCNDKPEGTGRGQ